MSQLTAIKNATKINTSAQLIALFALTVSVNLWGLVFLFIVLTILITFSLSIKNNHFYKLIKRYKLFYIVMFFIFLFNTPGEHIPNWPFIFTPSYEGLKMGVMQLLRITIVLALISLILFKNTKNELIAGIYFLTQPLSYFAFDVKRFSSRLLLTLYYVDLQRDANKRVPFVHDLSTNLSQILSDDEVESEVVELALPNFNQFDYAVIFISFMLLVFTVIKLV